MRTEIAGGVERSAEKIKHALDTFRIELPSWGFANTGTRFGKFVQGGAATTIEEKFADAAQVNALTGASPTIALHVLWTNIEQIVAWLLHLGALGGFHFNA